MNNQTSITSEQLKAIGFTEDEFRLQYTVRHDRFGFAIKKDVKTNDWLLYLVDFQRENDNARGVGRIAIDSIEQIQVIINGLTGFNKEGFISNNGKPLAVGDLVNYSGHSVDNEVHELCVVAYDYHGELSMFYQEGFRHTVNKKNCKHIEYLGNVRDDKDLLTDKLMWAALLII